MTSQSLTFMCKAMQSIRVFLDSLALTYDMNMTSIKVKRVSNDSRGSKTITFHGLLYIQEPQWTPISSSMASASTTLSFDGLYFYYLQFWWPLLLLPSVWWPLLLLLSYSRWPQDSTILYYLVSSVQKPINEISWKIAKTIFHHHHSRVWSLRRQSFSFPNRMIV